jgi:hypothetical protein
LAAGHRYIGLAQFAERLPLGWFRWLAAGFWSWRHVLGSQALGRALARQAPRLAGGRSRGKLVGRGRPFPCSTPGIVLCWMFLRAVSLQVGFQ